MLKSCGDLKSCYCPCMLAEENACEYCSRLQGKDYCDCAWGGRCPLYELFWLKKSGGARKNLRRDFSCKIKLRQKYADLHIYDIIIPLELAESLQGAGAFVFLRAEGSPREARFPVGVMKLSGTVLTVAVESVGAKTRLFIDTAEGEIIVTGPYFNGILGSPWIDNSEGGRVLLIAGGSGQAPAVSLCQGLAAKNEVVCVLSAGHLGHLFALDFLTEFIDKDNIKVIDSLLTDGMGIVDRLIAEYEWDLVVSAGPDGQHQALIKYFREKNINLPLAATNNAVMCCGEGLCGSCRCRLKSGEAARLCKKQIDFSELDKNI